MSVVENEKKVDKDSAFVLEDVLSEPVAAFLHSGESIEDAIKVANIVIDTNALLLPYGAGGASISATGATYTKIAKEDRLVIPAQVMREYLKNRPKKIGELIQGLSDSLSKLPQPPQISYPVLEGIDDFESLKKEVEEYGTLRKTMLASKSKLLDAVSSWSLKDPVLEAYRSSIPESAIIDTKVDRDDALKEMLARYQNSIPPGYKDASKDDGGVGDFLIWKTILEIGESSKVSTIFVSGEEKSDWQHRSNNVGFLPRFELIDEYRRASNGGSFFIIHLSELLQFFETKEEIVAEIRREERRVVAESNPVVACPYCEAESYTYLSTSLGASAAPHCDGCGKRFHVHRKKDEVVTHAWGETLTEPSVENVCLENCPECQHENTFKIGSRNGSTRWFYCGDCGVKVSAHRQRDGGILQNSH